MRPGNGAGIESCRARTGPITFDAFVPLPDPASGHPELHKGEVVAAPPGTYSHDFGGDVLTPRKMRMFWIPLLLSGAVFAQTAGIPAHGAAVVLFDGANLDQFDTFSPSKGLNNDTDHIFTVEDGAIHVSGKEFGGLVTKQEYSDYYLTAEFKWGEGTYAPRAGKARDAGILFDVTGPLQVWPSSLEFQMQEGATGDIYLCNGFALTNSAGSRVIGRPGQYVGINRYGKGPWKDETGYRDPEGDPEKPHGEWNQVELVVQRGRVEYYVNGKLVNEASETVVTRGKILFQSEGAEVYYRNIRLYPLKQN